MHQGPTQPDQELEWTDLSATEIQHYTFLSSQYIQKEKKYQAKRSLIEDMRFQIQQSIKKDFLIYTTGCLTTYDILVSLKQRFQPSTKIRERQLIREYQALKTISSTTLIEPWLLSWDNIVRKCKRVDLPETQSTRPLFDFIEALQGQFPTFFAIWNIRLIEGSRNIELYELIQLFRDHQKSLNPRTSRGKHQAFISFGELGGQSEAQESKDSKDSKDSTNQESPSGQSKPEHKKACVCGKCHPYKDCRYLVKEIRPDYWSPNPRVERKINDLLTKDRKIREGVYKHTEYRLPAQSDSAKPAETSTQTSGLKVALSATNQNSEWLLYNSFILDSGSNQHICHDKSRFKNYRPSHHSIMAGGGNVEMLGYGEVDIVVQHPTEGDRKVTLKNVSYGPNFTGNIVSLRLANKAGIYWDQTTDRLVQGTQTWCTIRQIEEHYVVEYNPLQGYTTAYSGQYTKTSAENTQGSVPLDIIHRRFAHIGIETIKHLPQATQDIQINQSDLTNHDTAQIKPKCEVCALSKSKRIESRVPRQTPTAPFEVIAFDLIEQKPEEGNRWILHFLCRYTGMNYVYILPNKSQPVALQTIKDFYTYIKRCWSLQIRIFELDSEKGLSKE